MPDTGVHQLRRNQVGAHKTDAEGCGTEVRAVLAWMVLEVLDPRQSCGPVETDLSLPSHSSTAVSYPAPKASGEATLARAPRHRPSQITRPLPRAKGWRQASRHRPAQGIQGWGPCQHPAPCTMPAAKGNSNLSALNPSHPRAGSSLPETAHKKKITPRECNIHPDRFFLSNTPELGLNSNTKQLSWKSMAAAGPTQSFLAAGWLSIRNISICRICFLPFQQEQGASDPLPSCWSLPSLLQAFSTGRGSMHQPGFSHRGALLTTRASEQASAQAA